MDILRLTLYKEAGILRTTMTIKEALSALKRDEAIVVGDTTFTPRELHEVVLETGEKVFWAKTRDGSWLSIDPASDEIIMFEDMDEEIEVEDETVVYGGEDYEFSYEGTATMTGDEGDEISISFREYESPSGEIIRMMENESNGDKRNAMGAKITEDELQLA